MSITAPRRLVAHEGRDLVDRGAAGAVAVDLVIMVRIAERDAAYHAAMFAEAKMLADHRRVKRQRRLRHGGDAERLRRQQEIVDIAAAIDRASASVLKQPISCI